MKLCKNFGIMQGRLSPVKNRKIQSFPTNNWSKEFKKINELQLKYLEWTLDYRDLYKNPIFKKNEIKKINLLCKKFKIKINSLTADCLMQKPFWKNYNKNIIDDLIKIIIASGKLKIKYIVLPLVDNGSVNSKKESKLLKKGLQQVYKFQKLHDIIILFESDFKPKQLKNFIGMFDNRYYGINYDTGNSASLGYDIEEEFKEYHKFIKNIHIKDRYYKGKTVRLGEGNVDFEKLFKLLKKYNYKYNLILQCARSKTNKHMHEIRTNLKFLKTKLYN